MTTTWPNSPWARNSSCAVASRASTCSLSSVPRERAAPQRLLARRRDEDLDGIGQRRADLARALDLDLEHHGVAALEPLLELGAERPVAAARVARVLDELARLCAPLELFVGEEVVVDARRLARARAPRGRGDRELELGDALEQLADQRSLADARTGR